MSERRLSMNECNLSSVVREVVFKFLCYTILLFRQSTESSRFDKMAEGQEEPKNITITVKTPKEKQQVDIEEDADIKKVSTVSLNLAFMA